MAWRESLVGGVAAFTLTGFVLLPAGPVAIAAVAMSNPASVTRVLPGPADPASDPSARASLSEGSDLTDLSIEDLDWPGRSSGLSSDISLGDVDTSDWTRVDWSDAADGGRGGLGGLDADPLLLEAYRRAASAMPTSCHLNPALLAAIGQIESGNLAGRSVGADHVVRPPVLGPPLTGGEYANIPDTDGGRYDGSSVFDRAVGPMQFIPSTWASSGRDGDGDGIADPQNVFDAALSAAAYLCAGGRDLGAEEGLRAALWSYNQSTEYAVAVRRWYVAFSSGEVSALPWQGDPATSRPTNSTAPSTAAPTIPATTAPTSTTTTIAATAATTTAATTTAATTTAATTTAALPSSPAPTRSASGTASSTPTSSGSASSTASSTASGSPTPSGSATCASESPSASSTATVATSPTSTPTSTPTSAPTSTTTPTSTTAPTSPGPSATSGCGAPQPEKTPTPTSPPTPAPSLTAPVTTDPTP